MVNDDKKSTDFDESEYLKHSKEHSLRTSIAEGCSQSAGVNMSSGFLTPFILAIGGNSFHVGLLTSLGGLADPVGEIAGSKMMEHHSRKKLWMYAKFWIILLQIPTLLITYLYWKGIVTNLLPWFMISLWGLLIPLIYGAGYVSWLSWLGDLVPANRRGEFFSNRNKILGIVGLVTFFIAGFILDLFKTRGYVLLGFAILFGLAIIFRAMSIYYNSKMFNPYFRVKKQSYFSFISFLKRYDNYGKFTIFQAVFTFAMMLSAPFFAVYMLDDLKFDYITYTFISLSSTVFYLIFSPFAGKFSDRYGNKKLIYFGALLFPLVPLLWMTFTSPVALIFIPGIVSGLANAAFAIGTTDFSYDSTSQEKRGVCFSYSALLMGLGTLIGSSIGGWLVEYLPSTSMNPLFFVFVISSAFMFISALFFLPQIKEYRQVSRIRGLHLEVTHPVKTIHSFIVWARQLSHWQPHLMGKSGKK